MFKIITQRILVVADILSLLSRVFIKIVPKEPTLLRQHVETAINHVCADGMFADGLYLAGNDNAWLKLRGAVALALKCEEQALTPFKTLLVAAASHCISQNQLGNQGNNNYNNHNNNNNNQDASNPQNRDSHFPSSSSNRCAEDQGESMGQFHQMNSEGGSMYQQSTSSEEGYASSGTPHNNYDNGGINNMQAQFQNMYMLLSSEMRTCEERIIMRLSLLENRLDILEQEAACGYGSAGSVTPTYTS
jgi:hypothetical protein